MEVASEVVFACPPCNVEFQVQAHLVDHAKLAHGLTHQKFTELHPDFVRQLAKEECCEMCGSEVSNAIVPKELICAPSVLACCLGGHVDPKGVN